MIAIGMTRKTALGLLAAAVSSAQLAPPARRDEEGEPRLPNGRSLKEEVLKAEHQKTLKDASELLKLAEELKAELEKNDRHVLSLSMLKKLEDIEKLARRIRTRTTRY